MTILFISNNNNYTEDDALITFNIFTEKNDFHYHTSLSSAKNFIIENLIKKDKHLDLIISDWNFKNDNAKNLLNWIRESNENYSSNNFQLKSIPYLLIEDRENQSGNISDGFNQTIEDFPNNHVKLKYYISSTVKKFRTSIADDLELIGLDPKTQISFQNHGKDFFAFYRLKILTREFVENKSKRLNYIWTEKNFENFEKSNDLFSKKMMSTKKILQNI